MSEVNIVAQFHAGLERYARNKSKKEELEIAEHTPVNWLIEYYGFEIGEIGVITINNILSDKGKILHDGDIVDFYPFFGGG